MDKAANPHLQILFYSEFWLPDSEFCFSIMPSCVHLRVWMTQPF